MKKKEWSRAGQYVSKHYLRRHKRYLKKLRNKRRRKSQNPELIEKTTGAWDLY